MRKGWIRAKLIEVYEKINPISKENTDKIYLNGADNLYPNTLQNLINESPTAKRCANLMAKFIVGKGVVTDVDINKTTTLNDFVTQISRDISTHYGCYVWVGYGFDDTAKIVKKKYKILNYIDCRKQIDDTDSNSGMILVKNWNPIKQNYLYNTKKEVAKKYYPFNDNADVVRAQIEKDFGKEIESETDLIDAVAKYRGQVMYMNLSPEYHYALPLWDSVYNDMSSEANISRYTNTQTRNGFLGKTALVTSGLDQETEEKIVKDMQGFLGAENSSDYWFLGLDAGVNVNEAVKFEQIKAQFDEKLFTQTKIDLKKNITGAFNNIPEELIYSTGGLFGQNADKYNEMKKFFWEQNDYERNFLINRLFELGFENIQFIPLYNEIANV